LLHVGIIMDGNGRWATARGLARVAGHERGAVAIERTIEAAAEAGIGTLTLYAFSADNWRRPGAEVRALFALFDRYLRQEVQRLVQHDVRLSVIGRRDRIAPSLRRAIDDAETATANGRALHVRLAIDYSARDAIWCAVEATVREGITTREAFAASVTSGRGVPTDAPDVDLVIRTGGEQRLSDFLLWESAYAEFWFTPVAWPDFTAEHLSDALADFNGRDRRFGRVAVSRPETVTGSASA
jgi:undecaprenyl diphosphate synthase